MKLDSNAVARQYSRFVLDDSGREYGIFAESVSRVLKFCATARCTLSQRRRLISRPRPLYPLSSGIRNVFLDINGSTRSVSQSCWQTDRQADAARNITARGGGNCSVYARRVCSSRCSASTRRSPRTDRSQHSAHSVSRCMTAKRKTFDHLPMGVRT